jgi:hypothetical protein
MGAASGRPAVSLTPRDVQSGDEQLDIPSSVSRPGRPAEQVRAGHPPLDLVGRELTEGGGDPRAGERQAEQSAGCTTIWARTVSSTHLGGQSQIRD